MATKPDEMNEILDRLGCNGLRRTKYRTAGMITKKPKEIPINSKNIDCSWNGIFNSNKKNTRRDSDACAKTTKGLLFFAWNLKSLALEPNAEKTDFNKSSIRKRKF